MTGRSKGDVSAWLEAASKGERFAHGMLAVPPRLFAAEAKRARKAAKRRRDAALTALGHEARGAWAVLATFWRRDHDRGRLWLLKRSTLLAQMRAIRRGEVQP